MGKKEVTRRKNPKITASREINSSIESMVLLSPAQCFGKRSVALPGGLGLRGSETLWVTLRNVNPPVFPSFISCQSTPSVRGDCLVTPGCPKGLRALPKCTEFQKDARNLMILLQGPCTRPTQSCASTYQLPCISDSK